MKGENELTEMKFPELHRRKATALRLGFIGVIKQSYARLGWTSLSPRGGQILIHDGIFSNSGTVLGCFYPLVGKHRQPALAMEKDVGFVAALAEAKAGFDEGGIPIGACLVHRDGKILGNGRNMRVQKGSATLRGLHFTEQMPAFST